MVTINFRKILTKNLKRYFFGKYLKLHISFKDKSFCFIYFYQIMCIVNKKVNYFILLSTFIKLKKK